MYVNQRTIDYGDDGRASIKQFIQEGQDIGLISKDFNIDLVEFIGRG
jgi:1,4-dihydroxy-6-naphthoate synthase